MNNPIVSIYGASYESNNLGVRALCTSLIQLAVTEGNSTDIKLLYGAKAKKELIINIDSRVCRLNIINFRLSPYSNYKDHLLVITLLSLLHKFFGNINKRNFLQSIYKSVPWINTLFRSDYVLEINGGDSFSDIYGMKNFILRILPQAIAILFQKNPILLPQTYGPYKSMLARFIAMKLVERSPCVLSRDFESARYLSKNSKNKKVIVCPDVAFVLKPKQSMLINMENKFLGLNISGLLFNGGYKGNNMFSVKENYEQLMIKLIEFILSNTEYRILLVPHVYEPGVENDLDAIRVIKSKVKPDCINRLSAIESKLDEQEIKGIIKQTDFFIGTRMHSCIAALSQSIPCIGMAYSKKYRGVFKILEMEDCVIDLRERESDDLLRSVKKIIENKEKIKSKLALLMPMIQLQINSNFKNLFQMDL